MAPKRKAVNLTTYRKRPRLLAEPLVTDLLPKGGLHSILGAVTQDDRLRLEIRDHRFNVYYGGGNLLLVDGRKSPWALQFDKKYFDGGTIKPSCLPETFSASCDAVAWVQAFPDLIAAMDDWWTRNSRDERAHCQAMASDNAAKNRLPLNDYLVIDLEYAYARCRFDMMAARRRPTEEDPKGWREPDLVFVEVKSDYPACSGKSGLGDHARDYRDIIMACGGQAVQGIKLEYKNLIAQKQRLGLLDKALPFRCFSATASECLIVFDGLDPSSPSLRKPLAEVEEVSRSLGNDARIRFMRLSPPDYAMTKDKMVSVQNMPLAGAQGS